jgi:hypothetical protein
MPVVRLRGKVACMNTAILMTAQLHRNPELLLAHEAGIRQDARPVKRARRWRRS